MARYRSKYKSLKIPMKRTYTKEIEGNVVVVQGTKLEFHDSILDTKNKEIIKFLDTDPNCVQMQESGVIVKIDQKIIDAAIEDGDGGQISSGTVEAPETLEEREAKAADEKKKAKKSKKSPTKTEKGKKVVSKKKEVETPEF